MNREELLDQLFIHDKQYLIDHFGFYSDLVDEYIKKRDNGFFDNLRKKEEENDL